jgi:hypothetical protein
MRRYVNTHEFLTAAAELAGTLSCSGQAASVARTDRIHALAGRRAR